MKSRWLLKMRQIWTDEEGITLVELLAGLALLGLIIIPLSMILSVSTKSTKIQKEQAEIQRVTNLMVAQMISISQKEGLYKQAGYSDYGSAAWDNNHMLKVNHNGEEQIEITDILDTNSQRKKIYQVASPGVTIHVEQSKNRNNQRKTNQSLNNRRDSFTIQETVNICFKKNGQDIYSQQVELDYRDESKAKGEVGGNGWW